MLEGQDTLDTPRRQKDTDAIAKVAYLLGGES